MSSHPSFDAARDGRAPLTPPRSRGAYVNVPILKHGDRLIASIETGLSDTELLQLQESLVEEVGLTRARGVIIDLTALDVLDSFATRVLTDTALMIRLRGAETVIVGMQPEIATSMVELGLSLNGVATALDMEEGLVYLNERTRSRRGWTQGLSARGGNLVR